MNNARRKTRLRGPIEDREKLRPGVGLIDLAGGKFRADLADLGEIAGGGHAGGEDGAPEDVRGDFAADLVAAEIGRQEILDALYVFGFQD